MRHVYLRDLGAEIRRSEGTGAHVAGTDGPSALQETHTRTAAAYGNACHGTAV